MKTILTAVVFIFIFSTGFINGQTDDTKGKSDSKSKNSTNDIINSLGKQAGINSLMGQFVKGINTSSFTGGKSGKNDILSMLSGVDATDYIKYASIAGSLAGALKGTSFLPDWANQKDGILDQLQNAGSIADVAGGVLGLSNMLNPSSFSKGFKKNKSSWTSALGILSMIK
ncbi:MAG TPA: hypothetical protein PK536_06925 [Ignavibacteria bacterium]|nr:hypothetical protein [Bacteroidota bacterium]HRI85164.1 hypothetical protein [Ignavibacteria bacterium]HRJ99821.1 hypothetical protein [Ignavibacteria bacterium]